ncbi:hypothetical protein A3F08_00175 [Candidatus Berkelbacteria bacterium RIFCSPHIGHO2_12_FULL_36_9]|uniref:Transposase IS200-like domain-containing protein n=1 Tax=Candidatus Berkelbacteria bacterium RIFCSPHIGHO2_12_FULL_36_9 TaxID=1797469 RepID=A0A1F5EIE0_9BACT|nr:MAG: hypothetical protein A3F08_00175 [Candidatus Berkelbacteria bacterium RIFCSPHIGHO2_12_FULL_36_9]
MIIRPKFRNDNVYHVYNRGVAKQKIFHDEQDYRHFLFTLSYYREEKLERRLSKVSSDERNEILSKEPKNPLVEILAYCLMPNHFHLILRQLTDGGISTFLRRSMNSYTRAYNTRYNRVGTIFQGRFAAVLIENDEQLLHVCRYNDLNPFVAKIVKAPKDYEWSSFESNYLHKVSSRLCHPEFVLSIVGSPERYQKFVEDYASYAQDLASIKNKLIDLN